MTLMRRVPRGESPVPFPGGGALLYVVLMAELEDNLREDAAAAIAKAHGEIDQTGDDDTDAPSNAQTAGPADADPNALPLKGA